MKRNTTAEEAAKVLDGWFPDWWKEITKETIDNNSILSTLCRVKKEEFSEVTAKLGLRIDGEEADQYSLIPVLNRPKLWVRDWLREVMGRRWWNQDLSEAKELSVEEMASRLDLIAPGWWMGFGVGDTFNITGSVDGTIEYGKKVDFDTIKKYTGLRRDGDAVPVKYQDAGKYNDEWQKAILYRKDHWLGEASVADFANVFDDVAPEWWRRIVGVTEFYNGMPLSSVGIGYDDFARKYGVLKPGTKWEQRIWADAINKGREYEKEWREEAGIRLARVEAMNLGSGSKSVEAGEEKEKVDTVSLIATILDFKVPGWWEKVDIAAFKGDNQISQFRDAGLAYEDHGFDEQCEAWMVPSRVIGEWEAEIEKRKAKVEDGGVQEVAAVLDTVAPGWWKVDLDAAMVAGGLRRDIAAITGVDFDKLWASLPKGKPCLSDQKKYVEAWRMAIEKRKAAAKIAASGCGSEDHGTAEKTGIFGERTVSQVCLILDANHDNWWRIEGLVWKIKSDYLTSTLAGTTGWHERENLLKKLDLIKDGKWEPVLDRQSTDWRLWETEIENRLAKDRAAEEAKKAGEAKDHGSKDQAPGIWESRIWESGTSVEAIARYLDVRCPGWADVVDFSWFEKGNQIKHFARWTKYGEGYQGWYGNVNEDLGLTKPGDWFETPRRWVSPIEYLAEWKAEIDKRKIGVDLDSQVPAEGYSIRDLEMAVYALTLVEPDWRTKVAKHRLKDQGVLGQVFGDMGTAVSRFGAKGWKLDAGARLIYGRWADWVGELGKGQEVWEIEFAARILDNVVPGWATQQNLDRMVKESAFYGVLNPWTGRSLREEGTKVGGAIFGRAVSRWFRGSEGDHWKTVMKRRISEVKEREAKEEFMKEQIVEVPAPAPAPARGVRIGVRIGDETETVIHTMLGGNESLGREMILDRLSKIEEQDAKVAARAIEIADDGVFEGIGEGEYDLEILDGRDKIGELTIEEFVLV